MASGWIQIHRKIRDCWIWENPLYLKAWIDILFSANYKDKKIPFDGKIITIKRGQFVTSQRKLGKQWGCSVKTVRKILLMLESEEMVHIEVDNKKTVLTVVNYDLYQYSETVSDTEQDTLSTTQGYTQSTTQGSHNELIINKVCNKGENVNNIKSPFPPSGGTEKKTTFNPETLFDQFSWSDEMMDTIREWIKYKTEKRQGYKETGYKNLFRQINKAVNEFGESAVIEAVLNAMSNGYQGIGLDRIKRQTSRKESKSNDIMDYLAEVANGESRDSETFDADFSIIS